MIPGPRPIGPQTGVEPVAPVRRRPRREEDENPGEREEEQPREHREDDPDAPGNKLDVQA